MFLQWQSKMSQHEKLVTELGAREEKEIARRFKSTYPEFFDLDTAAVRIGVSKELRASQTGAPFLKEVENLHISHCCSDRLPSNDIEGPDYDLEVVEAACYRNLIGRYAEPLLEFHKTCARIGGFKRAGDSRISRARNPAIRQRIADRAAKRLGQDGDDKDPPLTPSSRASSTHASRTGPSATRPSDAICSTGTTSRPRSTSRA